MALNSHGLSSPAWLTAPSPRTSVRASTEEWLDWRTAVREHPNAADPFARNNVATSAGPTDCTFSREFANRDYGALSEIAPFEFVPAAEKKQKRSWSKSAAGRGASRSGRRGSVWWGSRRQAVMGCLQITGEQAKRFSSRACRQLDRQLSLCCGPPRCCGPPEEAAEEEEQRVRTQAEAYGWHAMHVTDLKSKSESNHNPDRSGSTSP